MNGQLVVPVGGDGVHSVELGSSPGAVGFIADIVNGVNHIRCGKGLTVMELHAVAEGDFIGHIIHLLDIGGQIHLINHVGI